MSIVDEILASGRYTDRRGRVWVKCPVHPVELNDCWWTYGRPIPGKYEHKPGPSMRLLIERDQHRSECRGLWKCRNHPVMRVVGSRIFKGGMTHVIPATGDSYVFRDDDGGCEYWSLAEAMDAARALAVNP